MLAVPAPILSAPSTYSHHGSAAGALPAPASLRDRSFESVLAELLAAGPASALAPHEGSAAANDPLLAAMTEVLEQLRGQAEEPALHVHLEMTPPALGRIVFELTLAAGRMYILVRADDDQVERLIARRLAELRRRLALRGVTLARLGFARHAAGDAAVPAPASSAEEAKTASEAWPGIRNCKAILTGAPTLVDVIA